MMSLLKVWIRTLQNQQIDISNLTSIILNIAIIELTDITKKTPMLHPTTLTSIETSDKGPGYDDMICSKDTVAFAYIK
jgi:hypothetical protein